MTSKAVDAADNMETKQYLDYLDKEMTIMGILSAAAVIAPGGILSAILATDSGAKLALWNTGQFFIVAGSVFCVLAALFFYKERSRLAWFYGQICLADILTEPNNRSAVLREWLREADSWETWWPYSWGFTFLMAGGAEYLLSIFFFLISLHWPKFSGILHGAKVFAFVTCPIVAGIVAALQWYAMKRYRFEEEFWTAFGSDLYKHVFRKKKPHDGVYTRLKQSPVHGLGVFAIVDIKKGTYVFEPDNDRLVSVHADETKSLPDSLRKLYQDFCPLNGNEYKCPTSFNRLTPAWYLNHSKEANVAADSSLKFYAVRDIAAGEELTADYDTYSENATMGFSA